MKDFYAERGIDLLSAEVLTFKCTSEDTSQILREIIQETCDRLRRTERQRGENEVALTRIEGEISEERRRQELIEVKKSHLRIEARIEGEAEGTKIIAFMTKVANGYDEGGETAQGIGSEQAMAIFELLRMELEEKRSRHKCQSIEALGSGTAQLYVLPDDVNLHFGTFHNPIPAPDPSHPTAMPGPARQRRHGRVAGGEAARPSEQH